MAYWRSTPNKKAYIWNPDARIPYAIICKNKDCPYFGGYSVVTYRTIEADFDLGIVPKGSYQYCRKLTKLLLKGGIEHLEDELVTELCKKLNINLELENEQDL